MQKFTKIVKDEFVPEATKEIKNIGFKLEFNIDKGNIELKVISKVTQNTNRGKY